MIIIGNSIDYKYYRLLTDRFFGVAIIGGYHQDAQRIELIVADFTGIASDHNTSNLNTHGYSEIIIFK